MSDIVQKAVQEINSKFGESVTELKKIQQSTPHRTGEKGHIFYFFTSWEYKGNTYERFYISSWKSPGEAIIVKSWDQAQEDRGFKKAFAEKTKEAEIAIDRERQEAHKKCREKWKPIFDNSPLAEDHGYLKLKGIERHFGTKIWNESTLLIPVYNARDGFVGVQRIYMDFATNKYEKRFSSGIEMKGGFYPLSPFKEAEYCYLTEGFATAASVQMAFPKIPVICVFNAGNICPAIEHIRQVNPKIKIMIAADKDESKTGEKYAKMAKNRFNMVNYRLPKFTTNTGGWTDFNDLHCFESIDKVKEQLLIDPAEFTLLIPLGYKEDQYFYTSSENPQIISLSANAHTKGNLTGIVDLPFWFKNYGVEDDDGNLVKINWLLAESTMKRDCRAIGFFDPEKMRGRGVWPDNGSVVVNTGERIFWDGKLDNSKKSEYHYLKAKEVNIDPTAPILSIEERRPLLVAFHEMNFKTKAEAAYVAAWVVQAQIFTLLPWRFHLWIVGDRGSGKTFTIKAMSDLLTRCSKNLNSSASGIRQDIQSDTVPVIYDESEPDGFRIKEVIEMARQSSSNTGFETRRGTPTGKAIVYNTQTIFAMASIQKAIDKAADISRFFVCELSKPDDNLEKFNAIQDIFSELSRQKQSLFSTAVSIAKEIEKSFYSCQNYLRRLKVEARQADQLASMMACLGFYFTDKCLTDIEIENMIERFGLINNEYTEENKENDAERFVGELMAMKVDNQGTSVFKCISLIREGIQSDSDERDFTVNALGSVGIKYNKKDDTLAIYPRSREIKTKLSEFVDFASILRRSSKYFIQENITRIPNCGVKRTITIKLS